MLKADIRTSGDQDMVTRGLGYQEEKQNLISPYPDNHSLITRYSDILSMIFVICALSLGFFYTDAYALNLDKLKIHFLEGDYKAAVLEGEKILADAGHSRGLDELYYILGLSYMKNGNYLRASDIFEIILKEFKDSEFKEEAKLGLGDTYFLREDFRAAEGCYKELIASNPYSKLKSLLYYRLSQIGFKKGDTQQGQEYAQRLKQEFPSNIELFQSNNTLFIAGPSFDFYYTVQVGSFSNRANARNLIEKLIRKGYPAYIEEAISQEGERIYRVRVGKLKIRQEALILAGKLTQEGYPARIYP
jgi:tetratricopeptide (TPR) repeat protein